MPVIFQCVLMFIAFSAPLLAMEPEVHAVGVYEGNEKTNGRIHGPEVNILVDRSTAPVILSIGSYDPVRWYIETAPGTRIETILLHGYKPDQSEVYLNEVKVMPHIVRDAGYAYKNAGEKFRQLLVTLKEETGISDIASFSGAYQAPASPFIIDAIQKTPENRINRLADLVRPDNVPENLRPYLELDFIPDTPSVDFTFDGFVLTKSDETLQLPPSLDVPNISHPVAGTMDIAGGRLFGVTFGGEGFIYQYDITQNKWSVLASMQGVDAAGILYDPERDRLIFGLGVVSSGLMIYDIAEGQFFRVPVNMSKLPGYFDLYDPGNGPSAAFVPIVVSGDLALIRSTPDRVFNRNATRSRTYLINLITGAATLVAYADH